MYNKFFAALECTDPEGVLGRKDDVAIWAKILDAVMLGVDMWLVVFNYFVLANTFLVGRLAVMYAKPIFLVGFRMVVAGALLVGYRLLRHRQTIFSIKPEDRMLFLQAILFHIYIAYIAEYWAFQYMSSAKMNLLYSATPFISAFIAYLLYREKISGQKMLSMILGIGALVPILLLQHGPQELGPQFFCLSYPELIGIVAVVCSTYAWFVIKQLMHRGYSYVFINGTAMLLGGVMALLTSCTIEGMSSSPVYAIGPFFAWVSILILLANIVFYNLQSFLLTRYSIGFLTLAGFLCPLFGVFLGWFLLGEALHWTYGISLLLLMIALIIYYKAED